MLHSYPWYSADWLMSATRLEMSLEERGLYRDLLDYAYQDGSIPADEKVLMRMAATTEREFRSAWPAVRKLFTENDGRLFHHKVSELLPELLTLAERRRESSKKAAAKRWGNDTRRMRDAMRDASAPHSESQSGSDAVSCGPSATATATATLTPSSPSSASMQQPAEVPLASELLTDLRGMWPQNRRQSENVVFSALHDVLTERRATGRATPEDAARIRKNAAAYLATPEVAERGICHRLDRWLRETDIFAEPETAKVLDGYRDFDEVYANFRGGANG